MRSGGSLFCWNSSSWQTWYSCRVFVGTQGGLASATAPLLLRKLLLNNALGTVRVQL